MFLTTSTPHDQELVCVRDVTMPIIVLCQAEAMEPGGVMNLAEIKKPLLI